MTKQFVLTLVRACSVLSGALRYACEISPSGRGMYCRVKLLTTKRRKEIIKRDRKLNDITSAVIISRMLT